MKTNCLYCKNENPRHGMKTCSRKCADELKKIDSREKRVCLFCKDEFEVRKKETKQLCSEECRKNWSILPENVDFRINASKEAVKEKFGVDNVFQLESIKEKSKETKLEKYGDENYNNSNKMYQTNIEIRGENYINELNLKLKKKFQDKYGVDHHLQLPEFLNKQKQTNINRHGVENISQLKETKEKVRQTTFDKFGVENASQNKEIKQKKKETSFKNFGVDHHLKDYNMFQKHLKAQYKILEYKDTGIHYQGSYEKYFLELIEEKGLLSEVYNGQSFDYEWDGQIHVYHTDFTFRGKQIEIKSKWTYDNNGKNNELKLLNEAKWQSVEGIIVLIDKTEISGFIKAL
jgi:hypothetical protein